MRHFLFYTKKKGGGIEMRGFILPSLPGAVDWQHASKHMSEPNGHKFLEALLMGASRQVFAHLIVPTCFSVMMDAHRHERMTNVIQKDAILRRQDDVTTSCAACLEPIAVHETSIHQRYQVAIRILGALDSGAWTYDVALAILCRRCQTSVWRNSLLVSEDDYIAIAHAITQYAFSESIDVEQFMDDERYGSQVTSMALLDSYLFRLERLNTRHTKEFLEAIQRDAQEEEDAMVCSHCKRAHHKLIVPCKVCMCVWFCDRPSTDTRMGVGLTCLELSNIYHGPFCREIRERGVFHVEQAWYVDRRDYATVECFEQP